MTSFTPIAALAGGALIGIAAVLLMWANGRIAGVSGIAAGIVSQTGAERVWRILFTLGLVFGAGSWVAWSGHAAPLRADFPKLALLVSGLLVGYGTSMSKGCTSGHGVCGLARHSSRSLVATITFLVVAILTTFLVRHVLGITS
jgi:uncharacterized membrane protein YedE/YeeE